jgi:hypothetical protein
MTRPKVPEERRQRTAQACDTCKRRKQKVSKQTIPCWHCPFLLSTNQPPSKPVSINLVLFESDLRVHSRSDTGYSPQHVDGFKSHLNRSETPGQHHGCVITRVFFSFEAPLVQSYWDLAVVMTQCPRIYPQEKSVTKSRPNVQESHRPATPSWRFLY